LYFGTYYSIRINGTKTILKYILSEKSYNQLVLFSINIDIAAEFSFKVYFGANYSSQQTEKFQNSLFQTNIYGVGALLPIKKDILS
jgi:hypothetical protein